MIIDEGRKNETTPIQNTINPDSHSFIQANTPMMDQSQSSMIFLEPGKFISPAIEKLRMEANNFKDYIVRYDEPA